MNVKSIKRHERKGDGRGYQMARPVSPADHSTPAGCLFHDMMKDHGLNGCRGRTCNCPFAGGNLPDRQPPKR